mmetsp:Transcript_3789/g.6072  ORF Transcript_3789/g.6072 Transcript_3789/m.6072 type:complete len:390 (+) Transcript_3789:251-1420(+)
MKNSGKAVPRYLRSQAGLGTAGARPPPRRSLARNILRTLETIRTAPTTSELAVATAAPQTPSFIFITRAISPDKFRQAFSTMTSMGVSESFMPSAVAWPTMVSMIAVNERMRVRAKASAAGSTSAAPGPTSRAMYARPPSCTAIVTAAPTATATESELATVARSSSSSVWATAVATRLLVAIPKLEHMEAAASHIWVAGVSAARPRLLRRPTTAASTMDMMAGACIMPTVGRTNLIRAFVVGMGSSVIVGFSGDGGRWRSRVTRSPPFASFDPGTSWCSPATSWAISNTSATFWELLPLSTTVEASWDKNSCNSCPPMPFLSTAGACTTWGCSSCPKPFLVDLNGGILKPPLIGSRFGNEAKAVQNKLRQENTIKHKISDFFDGWLDCP